VTSRNVIILLSLGLLAIVIGSWLSWPRHDRATNAGDLVIPGLEGAVNTINEVRLAKGDDTHATLKQTASGWTVAERGYPADSGKVRKLLLDLRSLNVVEEKTSLPANYPALGVEDVTSPKATGTLVTLVTPAKTFALIIGKSSSGKSGFVRLTSAQKSLLAAPLITVDADPKRWLEPALIDLPMDRVKGFDVKPAEGPGYSASREKKEQQDFGVTGVPKGRQLTSPAAADPIAGSLSLLTLEDVHKAPDKNDAKVSHIVFHTFDGLDLDVAGHKDGARTLVTLTAQATDKARSAEAEGLAGRLQGWEFEIPSYKYDALFRSLDDLLQKPPEAKKAPGKDKAKSKGSR
jgi:hypothetical protein